MCQLMKTTVLLLLLLHCSNGITVGPINYVVSLVLTATVEFSLLSTGESTETSIFMLVTTEDVNSIAVTTSASMIMPSATFPVPPSLMETTEIIVFPTDTVTESVLFTTGGGAVNTSSVPITATLASVMTTPVISSDVRASTLLFTSTESDSIPTPGLTSALITTFGSVSSVITDQISVTSVIPITTFTTSALETVSLTASTLIVLTTTGLSPTASLATTTPVVTANSTTAPVTIIVATSLEVTSTQLSTMMSQTTTSSLQLPTVTATATLMSSPSDVIMTSQPIITITETPSPTPTVAPPNLVLVMMRFRISPTVKRDASNYTDIELEIANSTGISAERINIVSVVQESNETIVINATIVELTSDEFITLNTTINDGMVSVTFAGRAYASESIELQSPPGKLYRKRKFVFNAYLLQGVMSTMEQIMIVLL